MSSEPLHAPVCLQRDAEGIATLTLNLPDKLNPLSDALQHALREALASVGDDPRVRVLVLTGAGRAFSAGADLAGVETEPAALRQAADRLEQLTNPLIQALHTLPVPVLAVVNGPAVGGGAGLALAADIVIAARSAYFYLPFMPALGIVPDLGTSWQLPRAIGRARSLGLSLLGTRLSAEQACRWGLIWDCVDDALLAEEARSLARRLAQLPGHAAPELRALHAASAANELPGQLAYEAARQRELIQGEAFAEGLRAFREKRPPAFDRGLP
ncbi:MAG TPA: enoyl-CoA hydratase-related protein [Ramlibacter sp.]|nr:enoyl-CoA hydratase-related protein [Ramlibacter sp.]